MANRLAHESSLYLKQHANNPVDWFPWGSEALMKSRDENKPIFLSVGYSACHWCHVMEHESFEDDATARYLNEHFVAVKVDREERPDIDQLYMTAHQLLTREGGGWPLSVFLAPDKTPFAAGTYFPPRDMYGRPSFMTVLRRVVEAWSERQADLLSIGEQLAQHLQGMSGPTASDNSLSVKLLDKAITALKGMYDPTHGGFGSAPKFPHASELRALLRLHKRNNEEQPLTMACHSLMSMAQGGMYDQIGGGFHRYSVDAHWLVPHFEKMLYDNALLPPAYIEAFQITGDAFYKHVACETLEYIIREMTSPNGGYYSTLDADSEGVEGKFYVWTEDELDTILGGELAPLAKAIYATSAEGNFEDANILFRSRSDEDDAKRNNLSVEQFRERVAKIKCKLYGERSKRVWPGRDEKILTAWNGLMITAMAQAGAVFGEAKYIESATKAAEFVLTTLRDDQGRLLRTCGDGQPAKLMAYLEDYAYMIDALVSLYQADFQPRWIDTATQLAETMIAHYADRDAGGFYFTADDHEALLARSKDLHDGSVPSGNAMAVIGLLKLAALTGRAEFHEHAMRTLQSYATLMQDHPAAAGQMLIAFDLALTGMDEIAIIGSTTDTDAQTVLRKFQSRFSPNAVLAWHDPSQEEASIPLLRDKPMIDGKVTTYICRNFACQAPLVGVDAVQI